MLSYKARIRTCYLPVYDPGEPAVSYRWTGWVWKITGWSSRLQENYLLHLEEYIEYTPIWWRKTGGCEHVTGLDLQTLKSQPVIMPKNLHPPSLPSPEHLSKAKHFWRPSNSAYNRRPWPYEVGNADWAMEALGIWRERDDSDVATGVNHGVALSSTFVWFQM